MGDGFSHSRGVTVGRKVTVFKVIFLFLVDSPGNVDGGTRVGYTSREVIDVAGCLESSWAPGIVQAHLEFTDTNVVLMPLA